MKYLTGESLKDVSKLGDEIAKQFNLLTLDNEDFFRQYHDNMMIQRDCSFEILDEMQYLKNRNELTSEDYDYYVKQLIDTLAYCKAVIKLQKETTNLPKCIFG